MGLQVRVEFDNYNNWAGSVQVSQGLTELGHNIDITKEVKNNILLVDMYKQGKEYCVKKAWFR